MEVEKPSKFRRFADKVAVKSEPGLTSAQLMLTNFDLKPGKESWDTWNFSWLTRSLVEPERRQWGAWNFVGFWIADSFNIVRSKAEVVAAEANGTLEYLDDFVFHDYRGAVVVAILAVCLDWIYDIRRLHLHDGTNRSYIPHQISRRQSGFLWYMGLVVASLQ